MRKILLAMLVALTIVGGTEAFSMVGVSPALADLSFDVVETVRNQIFMPPESLSEEMLFAKNDKKKYDCLEKCAKQRYQCEKSNKDKNNIGGNKNWEESGKCQGKYRGCLDKCE